jgi:hypothetical protein
MDATISLATRAHLRERSLAHAARPLHILLAHVYD